MDKKEDSQYEPKSEKKEELEHLSPYHLETLAQHVKKALASDSQELLQMLKNPRRFMWQNFLMGVVRGLGIVFGMTVLGALLVAFLLIVLRWMEGLPLVGGFVHHMVNLIRDFVSQQKAVPIK